MTSTLFGNGECHIPFKRMLKHHGERGDLRSDVPSLARDNVVKPRGRYPKRIARDSVSCVRSRWGWTIHGWKPRETTHSWAKEGVIWRHESKVIPLQSWRCLETHKLELSMSPSTKWSIFYFIEKLGRRTL